MSPPRPPTSYRQNGKTRNRTFARTRGPTSKFSWPIGGPLGGLGESSQTGHPEKSSNKTSFGISKLSSRSTRNTNARQSTLSESVAKMEAPKLKSTIASQQQVDETESKPGPSHPESSPSSMSSMETRIPKKGRAAEGPRKSNSEVIDLCEDRPEESPTRNRTDDDELSFRGSDEDERKSGNRVKDFLNKMSSTPFSASSSQGALSSRTQSTQSTFRESNRESDGVGTTAGSNTAKSLKLSKVNQRKRPQRARQTLKTSPQQKPKSQSNGFLQTWAEKTTSLIFGVAGTAKKETPPPSSDPGRWGDASPTPSPRMKRKKGKRIIPGATLQGIPSGISESEPKKRESPGSQTPQSETRRSSRLSKKTNSTQEVVTIEIPDTDDEDDNVDTNVCYECDLARVSFGHVIRRVECKLKYFSSTKMFELSLKVPGRTRSAEARTKQLHFKFPDDLYDVGYFLSSNAGGENTVPLADIESLLCFTPQVKFREWLENVFGVIVPLTNQLPCVVCEFRCREDLEDVVADLRDIDYPEPLFFTKIDASTLPQYAEVLIEDSRNEREKRSHKSPRKSAPSKKFSGKDEEDELLIYPFECNPMELSTASEGLNEISILPAAQIQNSSDEALSARGHFLTIRVGDYLRLEPMEYLNDTLIDLWMSWISQGDKSNTHFFSTHFYTALASKGQSVQRWTEKKNLNVFEKKFIFIPVNRSLHWSLAVVVNPGKIGNIETIVDSNKQGLSVGDYEYPCILFFDSLKAHSSATIAKNIRAWLNEEWIRVNETSSDENFFTARTLPLHAPRVPYQDNSWDCGVFVCRYAYAMYSLRYEPFSVGQLGNQHDLTKPVRNAFKSLIADSDYFVFGGEDIDRIRQEMQKLIERLETLYRKHKRAKKKPTEISATFIDNENARAESSIKAPTIIVSAESADSNETSGNRLSDDEDSRKRKRKSSQVGSSPSKDVSSLEDSNIHTGQPSEKKTKAAAAEFEHSADKGCDSCTTLNKSLLDMSLSKCDDMSVSGTGEGDHEMDDTYDHFDDESVAASGLQEATGGNEADGMHCLENVGDKREHSNQPVDSISTKGSKADAGHDSASHDDPPFSSPPAYSAQIKQEDSSDVLEEEYVPKEQTTDVFRVKDSTLEKTKPTPPTNSRLTQTKIDTRNPLPGPKALQSAITKTNECKSRSSLSSPGEMAHYRERFSPVKQEAESMAEKPSPSMSISSDRRQVTQQPKDDSLDC